MWDHCPKSSQKFPRDNTKCRGKRNTALNIPRSIPFSPLHFMLYLGKKGKSIKFGTVHNVDYRNVECRRSIDRNGCRIDNVSIKMSNVNNVALDSIL